MRALSLPFFAEVDERGAVVSLEDGNRTDLPEELLTLVGRLVANGTSHATFLWLPAGTRAACHVQVSPSRAAGLGQNTAYVMGSWPESLPFGITVRELDVLTLIALGQSNDAIAEQLTLSLRTVTTHVNQLMRKLAVPNRTAAAVVAFDRGIIRLPFPGNRDEALSLIMLGRSLTPRRPRHVAGGRPMLAPLTIGAVFPLLGSAASDGVEMVQATQLAVDEVNERGGIDGRKVDLDVIGVDVLNAAQVRGAFETLAARNVDALFASYHTQQDAMQEFVAGTGIPYLHAATMDSVADRVRDDPRRYASVFQVCPGDSTYAPRFVEMMTRLRDRGLWRPSSRRLVVTRALWTDADLGVARAGQIAERQGWDLEVVGVDLTRTGSATQLATQLRASEPAAVLVDYFFVDGVVEFLQTFMKNPCQTLLYCRYAPSVPEFRHLMGPEANGVLWATVTGTYSDQHAQAFAEKYFNRFGMAPGRSHAGISYDRVGLIAQAWRLARNPKDPFAVVDELRHLTHRGVNGVYYFGNETQTALSYPGKAVDLSLAQAHLVFQIQDGQHRILSPGPYADGNFITPPWIEAGRSRAVL